jgi:geranylgeranyl pyrophosphate synthase
MARAGDQAGATGAAEDGTQDRLASAEQRQMLEEFRRLYGDEVSVLVEPALGLGGTGWRGRWHRWLYEPLVYVLQRRSNMFRSVFVLATRPLADSAAAVPELAAWIEIAWSSILMLDDVFDGSTEREGHLCAHLVYGRRRCALAALAVIRRGLVSLTVWVPGSPLVRASRLALTLGCMGRCLATQLPNPRRTSSLSRYVRAGVAVNISCRWALLAAVSRSQGRDVREALRRYADAIAVLGRLRNDLLDYYGGSSERLERFDDFRSRRWSFPTLILRERPMSVADRASLAGHFTSAAPLSERAIIELFDRYGVAGLCLERIDREVAAASAAVRSLVAAGAPASLTSTLDRWVRVVRAVCGERVQAAPA